MEAAIRWSPGHNDDRHQFLLVDVAGNHITLNEATVSGTRSVGTKTIARYDNVPNFTAFDWSKSNTSLLALGLSSGDASLIRVEPEKSTDFTPLRVFPIRTQRKCNSITFNSERLLAVGLDRVRNDHCLTVYDVNEGKEPYSRLCTGEAVSSVRFFPSQPLELVAAVARSTLRIYDLRESSTGLASFASTVFTKQINNIAIDPLDDNYFVSGGSTGDPTVSVWDKRWMSRSSTTPTSPNDIGTTPVFELRPSVDNSYTTTVWSIRFSGLKRGRFAVMSSTGELKLCDMATHGMQTKGRHTPANHYGGTPWTQPHYISKTHQLQYPYHDRRQGHDEKARVIAFDWSTSGSADGQSLLTLRANREVDMLTAPISHNINVTPRDDLSINRTQALLFEPSPSTTAVAQDIIQAQQQLQARSDESSTDGNVRLPERRGLAARNLGSVPSISAQRTESWLAGETKGQVVRLLHGPNISDALTLINVHRRRCFEGYRLDCKRNKAIANDDPSLVKLWAIIGRLEGLARNDGMSTNAYDLSYLGVHGIWNGTFGANARNRMVSAKGMSPSTFEASVRDLVVSHNLPRLENMPAVTSYKRLLCLEVCGWCFSRDGIEAKCSDLVEQRQYYRAVAVAYFQGHLDLSLYMLQHLARNNVLPNTGVGVLLASDKLNEEQRNMCSWMEEDAADPYLQSLLRYVAKRDWQEVANNAALRLSDRLSVALRYMSDEDLTTFIDQTTASCIAAGDTSGVLLTGLTESSMNLFQAYLTRTNDIQTTVLATSFTNPLYINDIRFELWKETYLWNLQAWRAFIPRTKYTAEHSRRSVTRTGEKLLKPPSRQITLRCAHCNGSLARQQDKEPHKDTLSMSFANSPNPSKGQLANQAQRAAEAAGTVCPRCGRHLPRCAICMQWLGSPATSKPKNSKDAPSSAKEVDGGKGSGAAKLGTEMLSRFVTFCASCGHGFHAGHAKLWFAKHGMCPVPDCECLCGVRG